MSKEILFNTENRTKILAGVDLLADSVRCTLGPKGRNVIIDREMARPLLTNDGATIAKEIDLADPACNMGVKLIREVSAKTNDLAGDGTTTATVLAQSIIHEGFRLLAAGANPVELRRGIQGAAQVAVDEIGKLARPVSSREDVKKVASISAEDTILGGLVADAYEEVGVDGVISVEESHNMEPGLKITHGLTFNRGFISDPMMTDQEHMLAELTLPHILVTDKKISNHKDLLPLLAQIMNAGTPLLIICEDLTGDALTMVNMNVMRGLIKVCAVKAPAFADNRKNQLKDIAMATGATFISDELGRSLEEVKLEDLGTASSVRVEKKSTSIVDGGGDPEELSQYIAGLRKQMDLTDPGFQKDQLKERLSKLAGGVAVLEAGAPSELEMKEQKLRLEDAIHAARAALNEGIVAGGGTTYVDLIPAVKAYADTLSGDRRIGARIICRALEAPLRQIASNAGLEASVITAKVSQLPLGTGLNADNETFVDMIEAGIVDSALVTRMALQSAASAAAVLLTTEVGVLDLKE